MTDIPDDNWSERDDRNAEVAPLGFPPGLPAQIELIGRMMMGAIKRSWNKSNPFYLTGGSLDDYTVTPEGNTVFINPYEIVRVRIDRTNTTAIPTLKFGRTNARTIVKVGTGGIVPLIAGDLLAGQDYSMWFNGANYVLSNPATVDSSVTVGLLKTANNLSELTPTASTARGNIGAAAANNPTLTGTITLNGTANLPLLSASSAVATDGSKNLISVTNTGSGNNVLATSPALAGSPTAPTQSANDNSTKIATTAYVDTGLAGKADLIGITGLLSGLTLSNNAGDAVNDIDIAAGVAASNATTPAIMALASALGKRLDAAWALGGTPGTTVGGLDTGSIANGVYHIYLMQRSDTLVVDACFSASAAAPTTGGAIPGAYNRFRRIGSIIRSAGAILAFTQVGDEFTLSNSVADLSITSLSTTAASQALTVPTGIVVQANLSATLNVGSNGAFVLVSPLVATDEAPSATNSTVGGNVINQTDGASLRIQTNTSAQIRHRSSVAVTVTSFVIRTRGWTDTRGRLA
jgi:hypothetical protein